MRSMSFKAPLQIICPTSSFAKRRRVAAIYDVGTMAAVCDVGTMAAVCNVGTMAAICDVGTMARYSLLASRSDDA